MKALNFKPETLGKLQPLNQVSSWFNTPERIAALIAEAKLWQGTPWCANSEARGAGVSCHNLPRAIYIAVGALKAEFPKIVSSPNATRHTKESVMEPFLDARPEFERIPRGEMGLLLPGLLQPGDLLGLRICHCIDHLGVVLEWPTFVHVLMHKNTDVDSLTVPPWGQRILAAWRPIN